MGRCPGVRPGRGPRGRLVPGRDPRRGGRLRLRLRPRPAARDGRLDRVGDPLLLHRPPRRAAAALPARRRGALPAGRATDPPRRRDRFCSLPARPDRPLQPHRLRRRRGPGAGRAVPLDHRGRLRADHRLLHLPRQQARELLGRGPDRLDRRGRAAARALRSALPAARGRSAARASRPPKRARARPDPAPAAGLRARRRATSRSSASRSASSRLGGGLELLKRPSGSRRRARCPR